MNLAVVGQGYLAQTFRSWALSAGHELCDPPHADLVWLAEDTPVDENGVADVDSVMSRAGAAILGISVRIPILLSSQVPVGTTGKLARLYPFAHFAYYAENIRSGHGVEDMLAQRRLVVGCDSTEAREAVIELFDSLPALIHWMSIEAAEMTKSALNAYLALNIAFANEIGRLCADLAIPYELVERALRTDARVGPKAYLRAGEPFAMAHLGRDVRYLQELSKTNAYYLPLIHAVTLSNEMISVSRGE